MYKNVLSNFNLKFTTYIFSLLIIEKNNCKKNLCYQHQRLSNVSTCPLLKYGILLCLAQFTFFNRQAKHAGPCWSPFLTGRTNETNTVKTVDIQCHLPRPGMLRGDLRASQRLTKTTGLDSRPCCVSARQYFAWSKDDSPAVIKSLSN